MTAKPPVTNPLPPRHRKKAKKKVRKAGGLRKVIIFLLLAMVSSASVFIIYTYLNLEETLGQVTAGMDQEVPKHELAKQKPLTILLLGLDSRPQTGSLNTDVIMVVSLNPEQKSAAFVSIPRDAYVKVDGWRARKANSFYAATYKKNDIAETYAQVKEVFGKLMGVPIDYVTVVNFQTLEAVVDQLGGIHVDVDQNMRYVDPTDGTDIDLKAGPQTLDGKKALDFVRYRYSNRGQTPESSDFDRNRRQQIVIGEIVNKLKSFNAITKVNGILNAVGENIHTDLPKSQIKSLITTYAGISNEQIQYISLEGSWQSPYVYLNEQKFEEAKQVLKAQLEAEAKQ